MATRKNAKNVAENHLSVAEVLKRGQFSLEQKLKLKKEYESTT